MKRIRIICQYCGTTRVNWVYKMSDLEEAKCEACKDTNLKFEHLDTKDVYHYNDSKIPNKTLEIYNEKNKKD